MTTTEIVAVIAMVGTMITAVTAVIAISFKSQDRAVKIERRVTVVETTLQNVVKDLDKHLSEQNRLLREFIKQRQTHDFS